MNYEATSFNSSNLIKVETIEQASLPHTVRSSDSLAIQGMEVDTDNLSVGGNLMRNSADVALVLRKVISTLAKLSQDSDIYYVTHAKERNINFCTVFQLIDQGKVSVGDVASEVGISSESLEAALVVRSYYMFTMPICL